jgi:hypothetical protein
MRSVDLNTVIAGPHCLYCPAEPYCDVKRQSVAAANLLSPTEQGGLNGAAAMVSEVEAWVKAVKEEMYLQMTRGVPVAGWMLVDKRATRKWIDEEQIALALSKRRIAKRDMYETTFLSPAKMEKLIKKHKEIKFDLTKYIIAESSGTTIAKDTDPGDAVIVSDVTGHLKDMVT